jgi:hypothetical protein
MLMAVCFVAGIMLAVSASNVRGGWRMREKQFLGFAATVCFLWSALACGVLSGLT